MRQLVKKEVPVVEVGNIGYGKSVLLNSHKAPPWLSHLLLSGPGTACGRQNFFHRWPVK
jgi:hypothetical protein